VHDVQAGQPRDRGELLRIEGGTLHQAAAVFEDLVLAGERRDRLRGDHSIALDERERDGSVEELRELRGPRFLDRALREPVLDDAERGVRLAQVGPQLRGRGNADPAVVDGEDRLGLAEPLRDLLDCCCLLVLVHLSNPNEEPARRRARCISTNLTCAGLPGRDLASPAGGLGQVRGDVS
jgi:hypothetical protein